MIIVVLNVSDLVSIYICGIKKIQARKLGHGHRKVSYTFLIFPINMTDCLSREGYEGYVSFPSSNAYGTESPRLN